MGLLSFRSNKKDADAKSYPSAPLVKKQTSQEDEAAAKIAAVARGKKARFEEASKVDAAAKIQKIQRAKSMTAPKADAGARKPKGSSPAPLNRQLSRRVSFGSIKVDPKVFGEKKSFIDELQEALGNCMAGLPVKLPCWSPPPPPAVDRLADAQDAMDAASAAEPRPAEPDATVGSAPATVPEEEDEPVPESKLTAVKDEKPYMGGRGGPSLLSDILHEKVMILFGKIDQDGNGEITQEEAKQFWSNNFAKVNSQAMFNEVDDDHSGSISQEEWVRFWENVIASNYSEDDLNEEIDMIIEGGSWVDFDDNRTT